MTSILPASTIQVRREALRGLGRTMRYQYIVRGVAGHGPGWPQSFVIDGLRGLGQDYSPGLDPIFTTGGLTDPSTLTWGGDPNVTTIDPGSVGITGATIPYTPYPTTTSSTAQSGGTTTSGSVSTANWTSLINNWVNNMTKMGTVLALPAGSTMSSSGAVTIGGNTAATQSATALLNQLSGYLPLILLGGGAILLFSSMKK